MNLRVVFIKLMIIFIINCAILIPASYGSDNADEQLFNSLKLLATVRQPDSAQSIAVIKDLRLQKQRAFRVGDKILDWQVVKILRGRVLLLKDGKISFLDFPLGSIAEPIIVVSSDERIVNRNAIANNLTQLNTLCQQAIALPYIDSGKIIGFKLAKIKDKDLANKAGIKEGDVIMMVNGQRLDSLRKPWEIYRNLRNQERIVMEIKRGEEVKNLVYYIN